MEFTIRNPHETVPLTADVARSLGFEAIADSSGQLAAIYDLDDEAEAAEIRANGLIVERVRR
jgi:2-methylisocitrate lyase-like PEP mutase family enzyme